MKEREEEEEKKKEEEKDGKVEIKLSLFTNIMNIYIFRY